MDIDENAAPKIQKYRSNRKSGIILKRTECFCRWSRKIGGALWRDNPLTAPRVMSTAKARHSRASLAAWTKYLNAAQTIDHRRVHQ